MDIQIRGLEQVQQHLEELPTLLVARAFAKALDQAGGVMAAEVEARTPIETGELSENVIVAVEVLVEKKGGRALVGFDPHKRHAGEGASMDSVALWVEMGHREVTHKPKKQEIGHVPAKPFMRGAFETAADRTIEVFAEVLVDSLSTMWSSSEGGLIAAPTEGSE
jgi:HK97 gp10 family phage protein